MNHQTLSVVQISYQSPQVTTQLITESPLVDSSFVVPVFSPGDDPIACLNKAMTFLTAVASSRFPSTNNQLRTLSNPRNQATIQDGRVTVQQVQGRQGQSYSGNRYKSNATSFGGNNASRHARVVKCYNCQDPGVPDGQAVQRIIPNNAMQDFEQPPAVDFTDNEIHSDSNIIPREKMIDSQIDDMIKEKLTLKEQVDSLKQNLSKQIKEKECLLQTFTVFKSKSEEKEDKYMENEINLEKKIKEIDNIIFKVGQSAQTVHILSDDFGKHFTPQQELSAEQAFWLRMSNPTSKPSDASSIKIEAPKELPKVILVNESLKKLKFHLARFDNVVKIRTTPDARTEGEWGFEHTKAVFNNEIIPFLKSLKDIFNVFDRDLLNETMESTYVLLTMINSMSLFGEFVNMDRKRNESCDKCFNLEAELLKSKNAHNDLLKSYSQLEKHCISLELSVQLNQDIFQKNESCNNQNALKILEFFENNNLKAQLQDKDSTICKLKDIIKSKREKSKEENVKYAYCDIETKNVELENSVAKLILENEHLCNEINHVKQVFKEQFDSIKKTRVRTKEHSDSLIDKLNLKSTENEDLKAQIQDKTIDSEPDCFYRYEYGSRTDRCGMGGAIGGESDLDVCWGRMLVSKMGGYNAYRCRESGCSRCSSESGCFKILVIEMGIFGVFRIFGMEMFVAARAGGQTKEKDVAYLQTQLLSVKIGRSRKYNSKLKRLIDQRTLQQFLIEIEERQCKTVFLYCICIASIDIGTQTVNSPVYDFRRIS
ncbi:hypothetical protein Tco_0726099 [Tanacetum coccineum]|uniref:Uncharacterized protein n=1 Tax=Tanacetum coccineum TaxID=301880 RepID=A0ABQ4YGX1_9ASTR